MGTDAETAPFESARRFLSTILEAAIRNDNMQPFEDYIPYAWLSFEQAYN